MSQLKENKLLFINSWHKFKNNIDKMHPGTQITLMTNSLAFYKAFIIEKIVKTQNKIILTIALNDATTIKRLTITPQSF